MPHYLVRQTFEYAVHADSAREAESAFWERVGDALRNVSPRVDPIPPEQFEERNEGPCDICEEGVV